MRTLLDHIASLSGERRPAVFLSASAVGYYGARGDESLTEEASPGEGFLAELVLAWEREAQRRVRRAVPKRTGQKGMEKTFASRSGWRRGPSSDFSRAPNFSSAGACCPLAGEPSGRPADEWAVSRRASPTVKWLLFENGSIFERAL